ncbi:thermonuclease family protein [Ramlibacter sp. XY19]|uniref:thermonuclease family protein n=1 Tax=Ramlibacter paludis TaxID=2908000 RepID=UPI0023DB10CF|nr:thermonuclease family protein [Ramlibacter paludis]MCG2595766.1 thermonuclease family protein [Ramlibacter paludis]
MRLLRFVLLLAALAGFGHLQAATFRGVVSHVTDGDTLWVKPGGRGEAVEIRLVDLDAPENCQPFGPQAKRALSALVLHQTVTVRTRGTDDYQRTLAQIKHKGRDVGAWLVREGHAWSGTFKGKHGPYAALEAQAREARRGLWANSDAMEPRHFRRRNGRCT